jgi:hypothetical protein
LHPPSLVVRIYNQMPMPILGLNDPYNTRSLLPLRDASKMDDVGKSGAWLAMQNSVRSPKDTKTGRGAQTDAPSRCMQTRTYEAKRRGGK